MNGREYFHESVVRDIVDILTSLKDYDEVQFINNAKSNRSFKSITSATKDLILTFPILVSTDIDPENAIMLAKAQEKKMASLLHILFTAICVKNNEDVLDYVKKFHSNLGNMDSTLDDYADSLDKLATTFGESYNQTLQIDKDVLNTVLEDLKESNYVLPDDVKESSLESFKIVPGYRTGMKDIIIQEARYNNADVSFNNQKDASAFIAQRGLSLDYDINNLDNDYPNGSNFPDGTTANNVTKSHIRSAFAYYKTKEDPQERINKTLKDKFDSKNNKDYADYMKNMAEFHGKTVLNNEYKKANELQPTMMVINFMRHSKESGDSINTAVIGIKTKIYPVSSTDICNRLSSKLDDKNILTNFIRATTNEIAFFRDFLFAIDSAKIDAKSYGRNATSNKLWKVLERRSQKSKFRRSLKKYNDATAITTLVLSENDAEYLNKIYNIDIFKISNTRKILDAYNFMCICILNQSTEVASILYDTGDDTFEMIPFSGLEREASDNSYKKMVNLLSKVSR